MRGSLENKSLDSIREVLKTESRNKKYLSGCEPEKRLSLKMWNKNADKKILMERKYLFNYFMNL